MNCKKLVIGVIGADVHTVGNKILEYEFREVGFEVVNLGCTPEEIELVGIDYPEDIIW